MSFQKTINRSDMLNCLLCSNPPCSEACKQGIDPGKLLRSIWFENEEYASLSLPEKNPCSGFTAPCEISCIKNGQVKITQLIKQLYSVRALPHDVESADAVDFTCLKSDICGIPIENPFLLSSSVVASTYDMCARAFEAGWAGACFKTICSFPIHECSPRFSSLEGDNNSFIGFKNIEQLSDHSVEENMEIFRQLKEKYPSKFILASIMGQNEEEWGTLSKKCEEAGADAIELNFSCPNMADEGLGSDIGQVPELVESFTRAAKSACKIPVIAKLTPNVANMSPAAEAAKKGGADGISAINTIKSVTGVNLHTYVSAPSVHGKSALGGYSGTAVKPIALRFIAELGLNKNLNNLHITGMGGIENWTDAAEFILLGAGSLQITTAVMKYGYRIIEDLKSGLALYMNQKGFKSISEMKGLSLDSFYLNTDSLERDSIVYPKFNSQKCVGCGRCTISCSDGGHQALELTSERKIKMDPKKCVGCHLCILVCPQKAISPGGKRVFRAL
ncbi:dihydroorotate dehydrogenase (subfamily 1) family protein [Treponema sp. JC4]|uniref:NAD-dependent dihydropyrimidine dehydrogenase subunit PreA n=1 Tax=Treponema sp. JC4 TaxID=1124982 RepID=UPI00025B0DF4|nr:NAD-dependent dihydropyrimidine dehydrogenase subunit PreA [Treponema sp. JC4]EID85192.1 dihydroorotate dehydrogenase (subfamily 1) family protein [Treponema sp. JC4]